MKQVLWFVVVAIIAVMVAGCKQTETDTFLDPGYEKASISRIVILPFENARLGPTQSQDLNRKMIESFHAKNPSIEIISPGEAISQMTDAGLSDKWASFIRDYETSGIPNGKTLAEIGEKLHVQGVMQGRLLGISQRDGNGNGEMGETQVTLGYSIFFTVGRDSRLLWNSYCRAKISTATSFQNAPSLFKTLTLASEKLLSGMPIFIALPDSSVNQGQK